MAGNQNAYYNYTNLRTYFNQMKINYDEDFFRWCKDIIDVKVSMFEYKNLPDDLTSFDIEMALMFNNFLCFKKIPELNKLVLCRYINAGPWNFYWHPQKVNLLSITGRMLEQNVPYDELILAKDNKMDIIPFLTLNSWINKIIELEKSLYILIRLIRFPKILTGSKEDTITLKKLLEKNLCCEGFVIGSKGLSSNFEDFDINVPVNPKDIDEILDKYINRCLQSMGIYALTQKKERLIESEAEQQGEYVDFTYQEMVNCRKNFIKELNEKYGYNIELFESYNQVKHDDLMNDIKKLRAETKVETQGEIAVEKVKEKNKDATRV